jgi:hypothetical protein
VNGKSVDPVARRSEKEVAAGRLLGLQAEVSARSRSLVQRRPTGFVCVYVSLGVIRCRNYAIHLQCVGRRDQNKKKVKLPADKRGHTMN